MFALEHAMKAQRGSRGIALLFLNFDLGWGWMFHATRRPLYARQGDIRYPLYRRLGGPQDQSGRARKFSTSHRDSIPGP